MKPKFKNSFPLIPDSEISELEQKLGVHLPESYRHFLLKINGGEPVPCFFRKRDSPDHPDDGEDHGAYVLHFYGASLNPRQKNRNLLYLAFDEVYAVPRDYIGIGVEQTGYDYLILGINGPNRGKVFRQLYGSCAEDGGPTDEELAWLADDFDTFINSCDYGLKPYMFPDLFQKGDNDAIIDYLEKNKGDDLDPIFYALEFDNLEILKYSFLNGYKTDINPLRFAGRKDIADFLIENGFDINLKDKRSYSTPIFTKAMNGELEMLSYYLSLGANVFVTDKTGLTPLDCAKKELQRLEEDEWLFNQEGIACQKEVIHLLEEAMNKAENKT
ncbi:hypothetical protein COW36_14175 [bacterium (Candidatus Blackallbacteria) CG17_big_fil_post_rev_8_21_14_2_50_48_46]|uniref:Knr4/Smi1-like domain-containing protein n=1 Tax=bacterium (Candidatus Blackallbacteria) CG17_big_fil_post_rev_8_21_14_2_50_48_46 TaxID=2014261 RepID=A0A2M7G3I1_9BACT|nr:MAG: hypothetical protein COW64_23645 [bacterium (Candidatus Blackallbacteria) CG18_big_fil_WC_8_21_14_2_50_49_26]PIW16267.1 MAG: hypothetical protein COW36_14175 [bacterium (Candidatus Blackallbacteria) CG17_big_fil_post_rev_8_21_14_2_50_48_46]PIW49852.1 MAG: hypothetical protein COW20_04130 [bacterium (Candidatus Blackallbacteria) CG13_big_fil_rev_8_21_14_2_50_49_14]